MESSGTAALVAVDQIEALLPVRALDRKALVDVVLAVQSFVTCLRQPMKSVSTNPSNLLQGFLTIVRTFKRTFWFVMLKVSQVLIFKRSFLKVKIGQNLRNRQKCQHFGFLTSKFWFQGKNLSKIVSFLLVKEIIALIIIAMMMISTDLEDIRSRNSAGVWW